VVTASTSFSRNTCVNAGDSGSDTRCGTTGSPEHVYLVRLARPATVVIQVTGFVTGGNEGDVRYRGTTCPGTPVVCTEHNAEMRRPLDVGDHYFFIEDDHAACQPYSVTFGIL
jgi:hypothetical protein